MRISHIVCAAVVVLAGTGRAGAATITGPVNPPPGGYTFSGSGAANVGTGAGRTWNYSALDTTAYDDLYWGLTDLQAPLLTSPSGSTMQDTTGASLTLSGNVAQVVFANSWCVDLGFGFTDPCSTVRYTVTASSGTFVLASSIAGLTGAQLFVLPVTTSSFSVTQLFEVKTGSNSWMAVNDYFNLLDGTQGGAVRTSVQGNFWYTDPVPEPTSLLLLGSGLLGAGWRARRRKGVGR